MRTSYRTTCTLLALAMAACGCHSNGSGAGAELAANLGLDMANIAGFVITQGAGGASASPTALHPQNDQSSGGGGGGATETQLYALNKDGSLTVVTVTAQGSSSTTVTPLALFDTATYVLIDYMGVSHDGDTCNFVAARKADGALYCVTAPGVATSDMAQRADDYGTLVQADATGNLVWINHDEGVTLLNLSDPAAPTQTTPVGAASSNPNQPATDGPYDMAVDAAGDALLSDDHNGGGWTRVFFPTGGFFGISDTLEGCLVAGGASSPDVFYFYKDTGGSASNPTGLWELTPAAGSTFTSTQITVTDEVSPPDNPPAFGCQAGVVTAGSDVLMTSADARILDVSAGAANVLEAAPLAKITQAAACDASVFLLGPDANGNGGVVRYDLAGAAFTTLVTPGAYALTTMAVSPGCDVTFYGQRASDGAYILGTIPAGSDQVTVNATGFPPVVQIARIN